MMDTVGTKGSVGRFYAAVSLDERGCYVYGSCDIGIGYPRRDIVHSFVGLSPQLIDDVIDGKFGFPAAREAQDCELPRWRTLSVITMLDTALAAVDSLIEYGNKNGPMLRREDEQW